MKPSRNDPCPCGSGRKYKACCLGADAAQERTSALVGAGTPAGERKAWHPLARQAEVWEAEVAPAPVGLAADPDAAPSLVLVVAGGFVVHGEALAHRPAGAGERAREVARAVAAAARVLGTLPGRLHVRDEALAAALAEEPGLRGTTVAAAPLRDLDEKLDGALEHLAGDPAAARTTAPAAWRETEAAPGELADFHAAAAEFFAAAPWNALDEIGALVLAFPDGTEWMGSVMGSMGTEFGLSLHSDPADLFGMDEDDAPPDEVLARMEGTWLAASFDPRGELTRAMQREVAAAGWEVAGPSAYPQILGINLPERRVTAAHVRRMTLALRTVALLAHEEDPEPETGVRVAVLPLEVGITRWPVPEEAAPLCPEGPGADPAAVPGMLDAGAEVERLEEERFGRLQAWLEEKRFPRTVLRHDLRNARIWSFFLSYRGLSAGAVTEYDLRLFLYDFYPRKGGAPKAVARVLPRSLPRIVAFLEEREGIRYPFAAAVLRDLEEIERGAREEGVPLEDALEELSRDVYDDLDARVMLHERGIPGTPAGWPAIMSLEVALLEEELQRRWLLWYDEAVRKGIVDHEALRQVLVGRQREWENTPHPAHDGRTPAEVVRAYGESSGYGPGGGTGPGD